MRQVLVLEEAAQDLERGRDFYDNFEMGVGDYFADSLMADLERLALFHGIHSLHFGFHRMLASRFPFGIYYAERADRTDVVAVLDLRRDPSWIRDQIKERSR